MKPVFPKPYRTMRTSELGSLIDHDEIVIVRCRMAMQNKLAFGERASIGYANVCDFDVITGWSNSVERGTSICWDLTSSKKDFEGY